jgi:hypothetical protein
LVNIRCRFVALTNAASTTGQNVSRWRSDLLTQPSRLSTKVAHHARRRQKPEQSGESTTQQKRLGFWMRRGTTRINSIQPGNTLADPLPERVTVIMGEFFYARAVNYRRG